MDTNTLFWIWLATASLVALSLGLMRARCWGIFKA